MPEKKKEYGALEGVSCPRCEGTDIETADAPYNLICRTCQLNFLIRQVAVWEEPDTRCPDCHETVRRVVVTREFTKDYAVDFQNKKFIPIEGMKWCINEIGLRCGECDSLNVQDSLQGFDHTTLWEDLINEKPKGGDANVATTTE